MINVLVEKAENVTEELKVETRDDYLELKANIRAQREDNEQLYKSLKTVLRDTQSQRDKI